MTSTRRKASTIVLVVAILGALGGIGIFAAGKSGETRAAAAPFSLVETGNFREGNFQAMRLEDREYKIVCYLAVGNGFSCVKK